MMFVVMYCPVQSCSVSLIGSVDSRGRRLRRTGRCKGSERAGCEPALQGPIHCFLSPAILFACAL